MIIPKINTACFVINTLFIYSLSTVQNKCKRLSSPYNEHIKLTFGWKREINFLWYKSLYLWFSSIFIIMLIREINVQNHEINLTSSLPQFAGRMDLKEPDNKRQTRGLRRPFGVAGQCINQHAHNYVISIVQLPHSLSCGSGGRLCLVRLRQNIGDNFSKN